METIMVTEPQLFRMDTDIPDDLPKKVRILCRTDRMIGAIQVIRKGGENNLHSHSHLDGMWTVLSGHARFYGEDPERHIAELGPFEGILIPRGFKYWFESTGDDLLVLHQVEASDIPMPTMEDLVKDRTDHKPRPGWMDPALKSLDGPKGG
jgi:mannose-6-phosphate isomerase-like protein (cupin superfamily)